MVARFREVVEAGSAMKAARNTMELVADLGATEVQLVIQLPSGLPLELSWSPDKGVVEEPGNPSDILDGLRRAASNKNVATACISGESGEQHWVCLPVPSPAGNLGTLSFSLRDNAPDCVLEFSLLATTLGTKIGQLHARDELLREIERNAGWFKTMDEQIRVLEGERQKFSALVNKTDAAIFVTDAEGQINWVNSVMARRYGNGDRQNLIGNRCNIVCRSPQEECASCPVRLVRDGGTILHQERTEVRENETRHLYVSAFPVRAPEGHVSQVLVMLQDITDLETLRRSEARYQLLFERSADAIIMAEPESLEIVMANRQARTLLGIDPEAKKKPSLLELHPESVRNDMEKKYRQLRAGNPLENVEVAVIGADNESLTCNGCGTLFDLDGTEVILIEFRDVTQMRELQSELARADHLITLGTMNAGIAHEFKNRLAPIRAFAQLITLQRTHLDKLMSHAPLMIEEIDRLSALVRDILDYARPHNPSRVPERFGPLMQGYANEFIDEYKSTIDALGIVCECVAPEESRRLVHVDTSQVRRAFLNLFKNSLEAIAEIDGEKKLRIEIREEEDRGVVVISDTGCGISGENLSRIFDPFFTTKGPKGTGLGMCITKSLIEANGGTIEVNSTRESGTRVSLSFPVGSGTETITTTRTGNGDGTEREVA